jgi:tetratricopeptide (TPR) repeat protein
MKSQFRTALACVGTWICFAITFSANAQMSDEATYTAWLGSADAKKTNDLWDKAVAEKQAAFDKSSSDPILRWNLALAQYGLMSATMRTKDEDRFDAYYEKTEEHLKELQKDQKLKAEAKALLSAVYGLKMSYSSMMGMVLGPKSSGLIEDAIGLAPSSALVWRVEANSKMFTPSMFGGDMAEAIKAFEKSVELFEKDPASLKNNWIYLDALVFQGQAYNKEGQTAKAIAAYEKALKLEPKLFWVKNDLLPKAKQKALGK